MFHNRKINGAQLNEIVHAFCDALEKELGESAGYLDRGVANEAIETMLRDRLMVDVVEDDQ